jgi:hypothetical protein
MEEKSPELSIVIVVVSDSQHLERCLVSLDGQVDPPSMEIIVPYEAETVNTTTLRSRFPCIQFHGITGLRSSTNSGGPSHEHLDKMRATGLRLARGEIVAILEDHDRPDQYWAMQVMRAHKLPYAAIGGAVENEVDRPLNWAVYYCDFGRYQNPLKEGPSRFLTDVNISYKRHALEQVRELWKDLYHEPFVNSALISRGHKLWLSSSIIVYQHREALGLRSSLRERVQWGRYYAGNRAQHISSKKRLFFSVFSPFLPFLLITRRFCGVLRKRRFVPAFIKAFHLFCLLTFFWSLGEFLGYVTARPTPAVNE